MPELMVAGLSCHMDEVPVVAAMLETSPMAVIANRVRRAIEKKLDVSAPVLRDLAGKCRITRLIAAGIDIALLRPTMLLPIRNLPALDRNGGRLGGPPPPRKPLADGGRRRPCAEVPNAH